MFRNLELKARIRSIPAARRIARILGASFIGMLEQKDTFLLQGECRLKLREARGASPELIYYSRADKNTRSGRTASFVRLPVASPRRIIGDPQWAPKDRCIVRKRRFLYLYENTRIHLDNVSSLGEFVEFEVQVVRGPLQARRMLADMVRAFGITREDIVGGAYADLLKGRLQP